MFFTLRYNIDRGITWFMKKLFSLLLLTLIAFQHLLAADDEDKIITSTDFCSLPTEIQSKLLEYFDFETKLNLIQSSLRQILFFCLDIKKLGSLPAESISSTAELMAFIQDINSALDIIEAHTYISAWDNQNINYKQLLRIYSTTTQICNTLQELDAALDRLKALLHQYTDANINIHTDINIDYIQQVEKKIDIIKNIHPLFPISGLDLHNITFDDKEEWISLIQRLPKTLKKIHLDMIRPTTIVNMNGTSSIKDTAFIEFHNLKHLEDVTFSQVCLSIREDWIGVIQALPDTLKTIELCLTNITLSGLLALNHLKHLEKCTLRNIDISGNHEDWVRVIQALPADTLKYIKLSWNSITTPGLLELNRFKNLEEINLDFFMGSLPDWEPVIQAFPETLKRITLQGITIRCSGLRKLYRFKNLEEINLDSITLSNQEDWEPIILALPETVKKIHLIRTNINDSGLIALSSLKNLEEINLDFYDHSPRDWTRVIQAFPETLKRITLQSNSINASGLIALNCLKHLEEIKLHSIKLSKQKDWASVIQALPETVKRIELEDTNIDASGLVALSRLKQLEEIKSRSIKLSKQEDWASVIQALPETVRRMELTWSDCPDECIDILKAKGIVVNTN